MKVCRLTLVTALLATLSVGCSDSTQTTATGPVSQVPPAASSPVPEASASGTAPEPTGFEASLQRAAAKAANATREDCIAALVMDWGQPRSGTLEEAYGDSCTHLPLDACVNEMARGYRSELGDREAFVSPEQTAEWRQSCTAALRLPDVDASDSAVAEVEPSSTEDRFITKLTKVIEHQKEIESSTPLVRIYEPYDPSTGVELRDLMEADLKAVLEEHVSDGPCRAALQRDRTLLTMADSLWTLGALNTDNAVDRKVFETREGWFRRSTVVMSENCSDDEYEALSAFVKRMGRAITDAQQLVRHRNAIAQKEQEAKAQQVATALAARAQLIREGSAKPESFKEAAVALDAQHRPDLAMRPMVQPDGSAVIMSGTLDRIEGELFICRMGNDYFAIRVDLDSGIGRQAAALRYGGPVNAVGRYIGNLTYTTVMGMERQMPVVQAFWIE